LFWPVSLRAHGLIEATLGAKNTSTPLITGLEKQQILILKTFKFKIDVKGSYSVQLLLYLDSDALLAIAMIAAETPESQMENKMFL
jgi:hypothetical protein